MKFLFFYLDIENNLLNKIVHSVRLSCPDLGVGSLHVNLLIFFYRSCAVCNNLPTIDKGLGATSTSCNQFLDLPLSLC